MSPEAPIMVELDTLCSLRTSLNRASEPYDAVHGVNSASVLCHIRLNAPDERTEAVGRQHDPALVLESEDRRSRHDRLSARGTPTRKSILCKLTHWPAHGETRATGPRNSLSVLDAL